jgi:hypothetical protein
VHFGQVLTIQLKQKKLCSLKLSLQFLSEFIIFDLRRGYISKLINSFGFVITGVDEPEGRLDVSLNL